MSITKNHVSWNSMIARRSDRTQSAIGPSPARQSYVRVHRIIWIKIKLSTELDVSFDDWQRAADNERIRQLEKRLEVESGDSAQLLRDIENNPICSVSVDHTVPCIVVAWKRYATSNQLRFVQEKVINLLAQHGLSKLLGDDTVVPTIHREDQFWLVSDWMPRAAAVGLRSIASKTPASHFGKVSIDNVRSRAFAGVSMRSFDDITEARRWLQGLQQ
jgi:hypothetical protein